MTNFELIKNMSIDDFADWLDENSNIDTTPWVLWFDKTYCKNCPAETVYVEVFDDEADCAWCELHDKCKYFEELEDTPSIKEMIKMWLNEKGD